MNLNAIALLETCDICEEPKPELLVIPGAIICTDCEHYCAMGEAFMENSSRERTPEEEAKYQRAKADFEAVVGPFPKKIYE